MHRILALTLVWIAAASPAASAQCGDWGTEFRAAGIAGSVDAMAVFDDGTGPALYIGGEFESAGPVAASNVVRWDGNELEPLGEGVSGRVHAMAVYDDGSGPALYVGGRFGSAGGAPAANVARWDGTAWSAVGSGVSGLSGSTVYALAVHDDGTGSKLYAGGYFSSPGNHMARWDGTSWSGAGLGVFPYGFIADERVYALEVFGGALYVGGIIPAAGSLQGTANVVRWTAGGYQDPGGGVHDVLGIVTDLAAYNGARIGGGEFHDSTTGASFLERYNGSSWFALPGSVDRAPSALRAFQGELLVGGLTMAGGAPVSAIASWNGSTWSSAGDIPASTGSYVFTFGGFDDGNGLDLYVGGTFDRIDGEHANGIARREITGWENLVDGEGIRGSVWDVTTYDDGTGPKLVVGGAFSAAGSTSAVNVAAWDGASWSPLGAGAEGGFVRAMAAWDDGSGEALYVGGFLQTSLGAVGDWVVKWDGTSWSALPPGPTGQIVAFAASDVDGGEALYMAGNEVLRWDGTSMTLVGSPSSLVYALAEYGGELYAGGQFLSMSGVAAQNIARWNGSTWSAVDMGVSGTVFALAVFDDGSGEALYAGGSLSLAGGQPVAAIARWNGASWSPVGPVVAQPVGLIRGLAVHDADQALYAAGSFLEIGDIEASHIARWDGTSWSTPGSGLGGAVLALASHGAGLGAELFASGFFESAGGVGSAGVAVWRGDAPGSTFCFGVGCPCGNDDACAGCANSTGSGAKLSATGSRSVSADDLVLVAENCPPGNSGLCLLGGGIFAPVVVGDGLGCTGGIFRYYPGTVDSSGTFVQTNPVASAFPGAILPGDTRHFQVWTRDVLCGPPPNPCPSPCSTNSNLSSGYSVVFTP